MNTCEFGIYNPELATHHKFIVSNKRNNSYTVTSLTKDGTNGNGAVFCAGVHDVITPNKPTAVCAIIQHKGKFIGIHSNKNQKLGLPGGKIDENETSINAIIREVKEETGLDVYILVFLGCICTGTHECSLFYAKVQGAIKSSDEGEVVLSTRDQLIAPDSGYPDYNKWAFKQYDKFKSFFRK